MAPSPFRGIEFTEDYLRSKLALEHPRRFTLRFCIASADLSSFISM